MRCPNCGIAGSMLRTLDGSLKCMACDRSERTTPLRQAMRRGNPQEVTPAVDPDVVTDSFNGEQITYLCGRSADKYVPVLEFNEARARFHRWRARGRGK